MKQSPQASESSDSGIKVPIAINKTPSTDPHKLSSIDHQNFLQNNMDSQIKSFINPMMNNYSGFSQSMNPFVYDQEMVRQQSQQQPQMLYPQQNMFMNPYFSNSPNTQYYQGMQNYQQLSFNPYLRMAPSMAYYPNQMSALNPYLINNSNNIFTNNNAPFSQQDLRFTQVTQSMVRNESGSKSNKRLSSTSLDQAGNQENIQTSLKRRSLLFDQLAELIKYIIDNVGKLTIHEIFEQKQEIKYLNGDETMVFDQIVNKYMYSKKTKQEMIKYVLRKCFKFLQDGIKTKELISQKELDQNFSQKYFHLLSDKCLPSQSSLDEIQSNEDLDDIMPFKKNSAIKTMNSQFLKKIFKSDLFLKDYHLYLKNFDEIAAAENDQQIQQFVSYIMDLMDKGRVEQIKNYQRLPWISSWLKETKELAFKLLQYTEDNPGYKAEFGSKQSLDGESQLTHDDPEVSNDLEKQQKSENGDQIKKQIKPNEQGTAESSNQQVKNEQGAEDNDRLPSTEQILKC